jgi:hypothetical protein
LLTVRPAVGLPTLSALAMMKTWELFIAGVSSESLGKIFTFIIRDWLQMVLIYLLVLGLATIILPQRRLANGAAMPS